MCHLSRVSKLIIRYYTEISQILSKEQQRIYQLPDNI